MTEAFIPKWLPSATPGLQCNFLRIEAGALSESDKCMTSDKIVRARVSSQEPRLVGYLVIPSFCTFPLDLAGFPHTGEQWAWKAGPWLLAPWRLTTDGPPQVPCGDPELGLGRASVQKDDVTVDEPRSTSPSQAWEKKLETIQKPWTVRFQSRSYNMVKKKKSKNSKT